MENCNNVEFTEPENKIRKKWLFWSVLLPFFVFGGMIIFLGVKLPVVPSFLKVRAILFFFLLLFAWAYSCYHCAYKKPGTISLLLQMVFISLSLFKTFCNPTNWNLVKMSLAPSLFVLVINIFHIIVFNYSYKLRKVNNSLKLRRLMGSSEYMNAASIFSTATNLEELNEQFTRLRPSYDSGGTVEVLAKAYVQQKKMLRDS